MRCDFYVYVLFRPTGEPCYVGKGCRQRWTSHERRQTYANPHLARIIAAAGGAIPRVKVREGLSDPEAIEIEIALIAAIGRETAGPLVNLTDGGQGKRGRVLSSETKAKISASVKVAWQDPEIAARKSAALRLAYVERPELRDRARTLQTKIYAERPEIKAKISARTTGLRRTSEQKARIFAGCAAGRARKKMELVAGV